MLTALLFQGAGAAGAAMDSVEGAGCRCRAPYMQGWILQRVQSASAECCHAECYACCENSGAIFVIAYLEMQFIFLGADFTDFPKSNSVTLLSESVCSFWNSLRQEYELGWCFFELPNFMASYGTMKVCKTCACRMRKVRILEVRSRRFVNARARIFRRTCGTLHLLQDPLLHRRPGLPSDNEKNPCTCLKSNP